MQTAIEIIKEGKINQKNLNIFEKKYKRCTLCGRYGEKKEISPFIEIQYDTYSNVCKECEELLNNGGSIKQINYYKEFIEDCV